MGRAVERGRELREAWEARLEAYRRKHPDLAAGFERALRGEMPDGWDGAIPVFRPDQGPMATRAASGKVLNAIAERVPWLMGGSADLAGSNKSLLDESGDFEAGSYGERNLHWGIREHVMASASSGMALHGGVRPYAATFFVFTDYARPGIRLSALMELPIVYVMTHDSIGLGEDGPTHQPVEHLASLRAMPHLHVIRPADANETAVAWRMAMERLDGPTMLVLTRQKLPILDRAGLGAAEEARRGGYVLAAERGERPDVLLLATGSEAWIALEARDRLAGEGIDARVVSLPCWEVFREQPLDYRDRVLPPEVRARVAIEAAASFGWSEWVGDGGDVVGIDHFGASAPWKELYEHFGLTADDLARRARALVEA
jgi:transketolase